MYQSTRGVVVLLVIGTLIASAGTAGARLSDDDTLLNFGYDGENRIFVVDTSETDSPWDCTLENGELELGYGDAEDDNIPVDTLEEDDGTTVEFENRPAEDVGDDFEPADEPAPYTGADGECGLWGAHFDRQVNHGQFLKIFHELIDLKGHGCLNRIIAHSDLGKGDTQVKTGDLEEGFEVGDEGTVEFSTATARCVHGRSEKGEDHPSSQAQANRDGRGKSANAPGHNK